MALVYSVVEAPSKGWLRGTSLGGLAISVPLLGSFFLIELRPPRPLLRLGILRSASLLHANLSGAVMFGGYMSFQFVGTLYLQDSLHWSPIAMALGFLPTGVIVVARSTKMAGILQRFKTTHLIGIGLSAFVLGYLLFLRVNPSMPYVDFLLPTMILLGIGFALCFPSINSQATSGVADHEQGLASGLVNTSIQVGGAILLAVTSAIVGPGATVVRHDQLIPGMTTAVTVIAVISIVGVLATVAHIGTRRNQPLLENPDPVEETLSLS